MKKSEERAVNINLDVLSYSDKISTHDNAVLFLNGRIDSERVFVVLKGDPDLIISSLFTLFDSVDGSFALFLDAVESYAEERNIDLETFWDEVEEK